MEEDKKDFWEERWKAGGLEAFADNLAQYYQWKDEAVEIFRSHGIKTVCDAACGYGAYSLAFASNGFQVSSFDISSAAAKITRRSLEKYGITTDVKAASILSTGYEDGAFDGVVASSVLDHMTAADAQRALSELYRITRPWGLILVSFDTPEESDREMDHEVLEDGSLRYADGTSRAGMIFHPYGEEEIDLLLAG
ncbi:MAG: class I SAM-dependent methyltransferase, partial [Oscillospiraceae bacterium]|nr:class I SAM-dependent methyltransferase [Oscillospiraceae bacterium]